MKEIIVDISDDGEIKIETKGFKVQKEQSVERRGQSLLRYVMDRVF